MPEDSTTDDEQVLQNVAERLKFFFSDANVRQDFFVRKFLIKTEKEANDEFSPGTVPIDTLLRFNTIKKHTTDPAMVVRAVKEKLSAKLELKDEEKSVGRVKPFTMELMSDNIPVSLYIRNLPTKEVEENGKKSTMYATDIDEIRKLFEQYGDIAIVKLRFKKSETSDDEHHTDDLDHTQDPPAKRTTRRYPLGACIVEFDNKEDYEKAASDVLTLKKGETMEAKRKLEVGGNTLEVLPLEDYIDELKKKHDGGKNRKRERPDERVDDKDDDFTIDWKSGCVIRLQGVPETCDREAILQAVATGLDISLDAVKDKGIYVDYSRGQKEGAIRFNEPEDMKDLAEKLQNGDLEIADAKVESAVVLKGEEEKTYWDNYIDFKKKMRRHRREEKGAGKHRNKRRKNRQNHRDD